MVQETEDEDLGFEWICYVVIYSQGPFSDEQKVYLNHVLAIFKTINIKFIFTEC